MPAVRPARQRWKNGSSRTRIVNATTLPAIGRVKNTVQSLPKLIIEFMNNSSAIGPRMTPSTSGAIGKAQALEHVAEHAEADHQPQVGDVVADRQRADEAHDHHERGDDRFGKIEDLHQRPDGEDSRSGTSCAMPTNSDAKIV